MSRISKIPRRILKTPNSGNSYYFRAYIPHDLVQQVGGQKSFRISLQSGIPSQSKRLCRSLSKTLENIFNEIRSGMRSPTIADIKEILRIEIRKSILHSRHVHLGTNEFSEESVQESLKHQRTRKENLKSTLQQNLKEYESRIDERIGNQRCFRILQSLHEKDQGISSLQEDFQCRSSQKTVGASECDSNQFVSGSRG